MNEERIPTLSEDILSNARNLHEWAKIIAKEDFVLPKMYRGKPELIFLVAQRGQEIGLQPMESVLSIVPMNEHLCMKGEVLQKMIFESNVYDQWNDKETGSIKNGDYKYVVKAKRHDKSAWMEKSFDMAQFKRAGLYVSPEMFEDIKSQMTESQHIRYHYPERTIQYMCRGWLARDLFPDVLKGLRFIEEVQHYMDYKKEDGDKAATKSKERSKKLVDQLAESNDAEALVEEVKVVEKFVNNSLFDDSGNIIIKGSYTKEEIMSLKGKYAKHLNAIGEAMDLTFGGRMSAADKRTAILDRLENGVPVEMAQGNPPSIKESFEMVAEAIDKMPKEKTNKYGILVPLMDAQNPERDLGEALDLKRAIQNFVVEDEKAFLTMINTVPVQDDIPFKSMIDFCKRCVSDELNKWLDKNFA